MTAQDPRAAQSAAARRGRFGPHTRQPLPARESQPLAEPLTPVLQCDSIESIEAVRDAAARRLDRELADGRRSVDEHRMRAAVVRSACTREAILSAVEAPDHGDGQQTHSLATVGAASAGVRNSGRVLLRVWATASASWPHRS